MPAHRTHDFDGLQFGPEPTLEVVLAALEQLDTEAEAQRLRLLEVLAWFEDAVSEQVATERQVAALHAELAATRAQLQAVTAELTALHHTKLFRAAAPLRALYGRLRSVRG